MLRRRRSWRRGSRSGGIGVRRICRGRAGGGSRSSRRSLVRNYLGTFLQFVLTVRDDKFSGLQTVAHAYRATGRLSHRDVMDFDDIARDDIHVRTLRTPLNCGQWNQTKIALGVHKEMSVHKLVGKETAIFIVEDGFQFVCAGGDINLVVDGKKFARRNFRSVVSIKGFDSELCGALVKLVKNLRELILRKREDDRYGLKLRNDQEPVGVCGVNDVPGIDKTKTNASGDGRCDARICQLKLGVVDLSLIGFDSAIELADGSGLRIELLLRNNSFFEEQLKTLEVSFGILALRDVLGKLAFGLCQLNLERPGIDLREKIAGLNVLAFLESDID